MPLEPRTLLADPDPVTGGLAIFGMTKVPVFNRDLLAALLGMDETLIHVHAVDAGGGFGARGEFYPEDFLVPWLARSLRRPVKWVEDRAEHLVAVNHSRQQSHRIAAAFDAGGRILGLRDEVRARQRRVLPHARDHRARADRGHAARAVPGARLPGPGPGGADQQDPVRHLPGAGPVRGQPPRASNCSTWPRGQLGLDRVELRRRNLLTPGELPLPPRDEHAGHRRGARRRRLPRRCSPRR